MLAQAVDVLVLGAGHRKALEQVELGHLQAIGADAFGHHLLQARLVGTLGAIEDRERRQRQAVVDHRRGGPVAAVLAPNGRDLGQDAGDVALVGRGPDLGGGLGLGQASGLIGGLGDRPALMLDIIGGLLDRLAVLHHGPRLAQDGAGSQGRGLGRTGQAGGGVRIGLQGGDQGQPVLRIGRHVHDAIDEARRLHGGHGAIGDHAFLELARIVGRGSLERDGHALAALEAGVDGRDRMHVAVESAGRFGRPARERHVLADLRGRLGLHVADLGETGGRVLGVGDGGLDHGLGRAAIDGVLFRSADGRGIGDLLDSRRRLGDGRGDGQRLRRGDRGRHGQRRRGPDGRRGPHLAEGRGVDHSGRDGVHVVFGVVLLSRGGRRGQENGGRRAGGADTGGCDERGDGCGNPEPVTHG